MRSFIVFHEKYFYDRNSRTCYPKIEFSKFCQYKILTARFRDFGAPPITIFTQSYNPYCNEDIHHVCLLVFVEAYTKPFVILSVIRSLRTPKYSWFIIRNVYQIEILFTRKYTNTYTRTRTYIQFTNQLFK